MKTTGNGKDFASITSTQLSFHELVRIARRKYFNSLQIAAENIGICPRKLCDYETGKELPLPEIAAQMAKAYKNPSICTSYCENCPVGRVAQASGLPEVTAQEMVGLILALQNNMESLEGIMAAYLKKQQTQTHMGTVVQLKNKKPALRKPVQEQELANQA